MTRAEKQRLRRGMVQVIHNNPGINTRHIINFINAPGINITKHHINGNLSWLSKTGQVHLVTLQPRQCTIAL